MTDVTLDASVCARNDMRGVDVDHRYWCGECSFKTPWLGASEGARQQLEHYAGKHPGTPPGGQVEVRRADPDSGCGRYGCLPLTAVALLLLAIVAACHR